MSELIKCKCIGNSEVGYLSFFQDFNINFPIRRIYFVYDVGKGIRRGFHAHKKLKQFAWCPYGDITFILDNGNTKQEFRLDDPTVGLKIEEGIWREMVWNKENSVLCVAASDYYDENDYIRSYEEYVRLVNEGYWNGCNRN